MNWVLFLMVYENKWKFINLKKIILNKTFTAARTTNLQR